MATTSEGCPYIGLQPYTEEDREYFFGRESDTEIIASNLFIAPLTILYGTSGVGKSSVLQAGVIPHLRENRRVIVVLFNNWQGQNFHAALKEKILQTVVTSTDKSQQDVLAAISEANHAPAIVGLAQLPLDELLTGCAIAFRRRILLIFDQFEEYFLYNVPTTGTQGFDAEFARAVNQPESGVNFMISMREEELSKLDRFRPRIPNLLSNLLRLDNLDGEAATNAIQEPLRVYNERHPSDQMQIEKDLVSAILEQVRPRHVQQAAAPLLPARETTGTQAVDRIETPFLQLVLIRLWETEKQKKSQVLRLKTFNDLGGALEIARTHLDKVMDQLTDAQAATAAAALRFLVTPTGSKIALDSASLASFAEQSENDVLAVLELLGSGREMRILRKVTARNQPDRYELFHDVLGPAILDWRSRYVQAQQRIQERTEIEREFSLERQKRLRQAVAVLGMLLVVMAGTAVYAFSQRSEARQRYAEAVKQEAEAEKQRQDALDQKNKAVAARAEAEQVRNELADAKKESDKQRDLAVSAQRTAEAAKLQANQQATLATNLNKISDANLAGFDAARLGNSEGAITSFQQALSLSMTQKNTPGVVYAVINLADAYASKGVAIPRELFDLFDAFDGGDVKELLTPENYQLESYLASLQRTLSDRKDDVLENQKKAIQFYDSALRVNRTQKESDLKKEASIQQRIGDLQLSLAFVNLALAPDDSQEKAPDLGPTIKSYNEASDNYAKAGLPFEEGILQTRVAFMLSMLTEFGQKNNNEPADFTKIISAYKRALTGFHNARGRHFEAAALEAATMVRLANIYNDLPKSSENSNTAISYYSEAAKLYGDLHDREKEGENYSTSANLYATLPTPNKDLAFEQYGKALTAFLAAESALPNEDTQLSAIEQESKEKRASLHRQAMDLIPRIGNLYLQDPKPHPNLEEFFKGVVVIQGNDYAAKAGVLETIARMYLNDLKEIPIAIEFYRDESQAWKKAGDSLEQAKTLITIGSLYSTNKDTTNTKAAFEEARAIYQHLPGPLNYDTRNQAASDLISIGKTYTDFNESTLALETYDQAFSLFSESEGKPSENYRFEQIVQSAVKLIPEADAPKFFARLTDFYHKQKDTAGEASAYELAGERYAIWGKTAEALDNYNNALALRPTPAGQLAKVGRLYYAAGNPGGAKVFFQKVLDSYRRQKNFNDELSALTAVAAFYRDVGDVPAEIDNYTQAVQSSCRHSNYYEMANSLRTLSLTFKNLGDSGESLRLASLANNPKSITDCNSLVIKK